MVLKVLLALAAGWIVVLLVLLFCEIRIAQKATQSSEQVFAMYRELESSALAWIEADKRAERARAEFYQRCLEKCWESGSEIDADEDGSAD